MTFLDWLSAIADTLGIITVLVGVPTAIKYLFVEPRRRRQLGSIIKDPNGNRSAILSIGLGTMAAMENQVTAFLVSNPILSAQFGELKKGNNFFLLEKRENMPEPAPDASEPYSAAADKYLDEMIVSLQKLMIEMANQGVRKIHLFYQGPAILLAPVGAALANRFTVVCYHYSRKSGYFCVGLMQDK